MLNITSQDISLFHTFIVNTVKNEDHREKLLTVVEQNKPLLSKAVLLFLVGADMEYIRTVTKMPDGYYKSFLNQFYGLYGVYPKLIFMFPAFREDPKIMSQVFYTAAYNRNDTFFKELDKILEAYNKLVKINGRVTPRSVDSEKPKVEEKVVDKVTDIVPEPPVSNLLDEQAQGFLEKYDYDKKLKLLDALKKDPEGFVKNMFNSKS